MFSVFPVRRHVLIRTLRNAGVKPRGAKILELGFDRGGAGWHFEACDIGAPLPLNAAHGACDIATAFEVLFHLIEEKSWKGAPDNLTAEIKPGGHVLIYDTFQKKETAVSHVKRRTLARYEEALHARGFEILPARPIFFL